MKPGGVEIGGLARPGGVVVGGVAPGDFGPEVVVTDPVAVPPEVVVVLFGFVVAVDVSAFDVVVTAPEAVPAPDVEVAPDEVAVLDVVAVVSHAGTEMVSVSSVTAPLRASTRPETVTSVVTVTDVNAMIVPVNP